MRIYKIYLLALISILSLISITDTFAAHIVGGDARYTFLNFDQDTTEATFLIEFFMYRDAFSNGAPFDSPGNNNGGANFGIYRQNLNGTWTFIDAFRNRDHGLVTDVERVDDPCVDEPTDVGVEKTRYAFEVTLDISNTSYIITYQRCCRNNSINNIRDPGDTGAVFDIEITAAAQSLGNSSPRFNNFPPIFICGDQDVDFDHSASDIDNQGDVLRYTFCAPFESGGPTGTQPGQSTTCCTCVRPDPSTCPPQYGLVNFLPPFTATAPLAGNPVVTIDPISGLISGVPEIPGQFVVGVCVEERRNGVLLSTTRRDFQFNVVECTPNVFAQLAGDEIDAGGLDGSTFFIQSCGEETVFIENTSFDENEIFDYHWTFFNPNGTLLDEIQGGSSVRDVNITFPGVGDYTGVMILNEGTECSDTANFMVSLFPAINAEYIFNYDTCAAGDVFFTDFSETGASSEIIDWDWDFGDGTFSALKDPDHRFSSPGIREVILTVRDLNDCEDTFVATVDWRPLPQELIVEPSTFVGCNPSEIFFDNLSAPIDSSYDITWDFGDGTFGTEVSPTHIFEEPGNYDISLEVISPLGCVTTKDFNSLIRVLEAPVAAFECSPDDPNVFRNTVQFTDQSQRAGAWQWDFGGDGNAFIQNPSHAFQDTGVFRVNLTVFHPSTSCTDTISKLVDVRPVVRYFLPNAFTPNNDASNDLFFGAGFLDGLADFNLSVWNRWGEMVFETTDPRDGWNGQKNNTGALSPQGVYVYQVSFVGPRGEKEAMDGHVTLIR